MHQINSNYLINTIRLKSDLLFLKKTLKSFDIIDTTFYRDKVDEIISAALPAKLLKKKKTINTSSKNVMLTDE